MKSQSTMRQLNQRVTIMTSIRRGIRTSTLSVVAAQSATVAVSEADVVVDGIEQDAGLRTRSSRHFGQLVDGPS